MRKNFQVAMNDYLEDNYQTFITNAKAKDLDYKQEMDAYAEKIQDLEKKYKK